MLGIPFVLLMAASNFPPEISIYDSRDDKSKAWILIDDCPVQIDKARMDDIRYVEKMVQKICHIDLGAVIE